MQRVRFVMVGGFLGAGKTTAVARLARHYLQAGQRVGVVTNDQAYGLVDTHALRSQGFRVGEVPGACFCCKFDDLVETAARLAAEERPDVVLAEPVGSCTDLVATVLEPLRHLHGDRYELGPLAVLLKPEHGRKILDGSGAGFTPQAEYIFLKQIEEADLVVLNKSDKLSADQRSQLLDLVRGRFPDKQVCAASGLTGEGFDVVLDALARPRRGGQLAMEVDYERYAAGEAELGWLNGTATLRAATGDDPIDLDDVLLKIAGRLRELCREAEAEPAHLKILAAADANTAVVNLVAAGEAPELSVASRARPAAADLIVNARVAGDPEMLAGLVRQALEETAAAARLELELGPLQRFRPAPPVPTHRYAGAAAPASHSAGGEGAGGEGAGGSGSGGGGASRNGASGEGPGEADRD